MGFRERIYTPLFTNFDSIGDGSGSLNMTGDYSESGEGEKIFLIKPPKGVVYSYFKLLSVIGDNKNINSGGYGGKSQPLDNGIIIRLMRGDKFRFALTCEPITTSAGWAANAFDWQIIKEGSGDNLAIARWYFEENGIPLYVNGSLDERLEMVLRDDFSHLKSHFVRLQGRARSANLTF